MREEIRGIVLDGLGQGRAFTQLDWVRQQFRDKLGFDPYPGTLNVRVKDAGALTSLRARQAIAIEPAAGYCAAKCLRVRVYRERSRMLNGRVDAAWIIPDVPNYPCDLIELMAPMSLRDALGVRAGDEVKVEIAEGAK